MFDPLGQFEVLNFFLVYSNIFNSVANMIPSFEDIQSMISSSAPKSLSFFNLIPEGTNTFKDKYVDVNQFLTSEA